MELTASELWTRILEGAEARLPEQSFRTWLSGTTAVALTEDELRTLIADEYGEETVGDVFPDHDQTYVHGRND
jgi:predicted subunit of tRNA(5-methylaminomethyl-2-thiouridylate) methyltransferase